MIRGRLRRRTGDGAPGHADDEFVEIDPAELTGIFATPPWLRDLGLTAWPLGRCGAVTGRLGLDLLAHPDDRDPSDHRRRGGGGRLTAGRLARSPPRAPSGGAALLLLAIIALCGLVVVLVVGGITSQAGDLSGRLSDAKHTIQGWLTDLGVDPTKAHGATQDAGSSSSSAVKALLDGLGSGITALSSLIFFLSLTALSLFFLLRDGPAIRAWGERHLGVPMPVARTICQRSLESLRGYFLGVTLVAAFNAVVVWWARWSSAFRSRGRSPRSHSSPDTFLTLERGPRGRSPSWWR